MSNQIIAIIVAMLSGLVAGLFLTALASANKDPIDLDFLDDEEDIYREWLAYKSTGLNPEEIINMRVEVRELRKKNDRLKADKLPGWLDSAITDSRCKSCKLPQPKIVDVGGVFADETRVQAEYALICENSERCRKAIQDQNM